MSWNTLARAGVLLAAVVGPRAHAAGGDEVGQGGYRQPGGARWEWAAQWGASSEQGSAAPAGPPLFAGMRASYRAAQGVALDASVQALFNSGRVQGLVGPRVFVGGRPASAWAGLKAGGAWIPRVPGGVRFALSPEVGMSVRVHESLELGLGGAWDVPLGGDAAPNLRVGLELGWRF